MADRGSPAVSTTTSTPMKRKRRAASAMSTALSSTDVTGGLLEWCIIDLKDLSALAQSNSKLEAGYTKRNWLFCREITPLSLMHSACHSTRAMTPSRQVETGHRSCKKAKKASTCMFRLPDISSIQESCRPKHLPSC